MKIRFGVGFCEEDAGEYYVYTHSVAGHGVFYVGKGKGYRIGENFGRNSDWLKVADKYGLDKIIVMQYRNTKRNEFNLDLGIEKPKFIFQTTLGEYLKTITI